MPQANYQVLSRLDRDSTLIQENLKLRKAPIGYNTTKVEYKLYQELIGSMI